MKFHTEFPDYPATEMPGLPEGYGFVETSWRNDMCPSFTSDEIGMTVWIDYPHVDDREHGGKRFVVQSQDHGVETGEFSLDTDDWNEVLAFIVSRKFAKMSADQLNDWYERTVGYRPQVDEPKMTDAELRELCESYVKAVAEESE